MVRVANLKNIRINHGLTQMKLSDLAGLTQVYISTMESNKMPMTEEAAKKIFIGFKEAGEGFGYGSVEELRAAHSASFYKNDVQEFVYDLLYEIYMRQTILKFIDEKQSIPDQEECPVIVKYIREKEVLKNADINK